MLVGLSKGVWKWVVLMLTLKLGIFPLNSYVIYIYRSIKIEKVFIISIMGKIVYILILVSMIENMDWIKMIGIVSIIIGSIGSISNIEKKSIIGYSSIINVGLTVWLIISSKEWSIEYILYYNLILLILFKSIKRQNKEWMLYSLFMAISIPPFLGFKIKWISLVVLIKNNWIGIVIFIYIILTISSYIYYRWIERVLLIKKKRNKIERVSVDSVLLLLTLI